METVVFKPGDTVVTRKAHPCGGNRWEVTRGGADVKLKCLGCGHTVMLDYLAAVKSVKRFENKRGESTP